MGRKPGNLVIRWLVSSSHQSYFWPHVFFLFSSDGEVNFIHIKQLLHKANTEEKYTKKPHSHPLPAEGNGAGQSSYQRQGWSVGLTLPTVGGSKLKSGWKVQNKNSSSNAWRHWPSASHPGCLALGHISHTSQVQRVLVLGKRDLRPLSSIWHFLSIYSGTQAFLGKSSPLPYPV